jgi:hypothetical protein
MGDETTKTQESTTARIWTESKKRIQNVAREKAAREKRDVTECELLSIAADKYCDEEEPKLGLV